MSVNELSNPEPKINFEKKRKSYVKQKSEVPLPPHNYAKYKENNGASRVKDQSKSRCNANQNK